MGVLRAISGGRLIALRALTTVGRSRKCDLSLDHRAVSAMHATLRWTDGGWVLQDLGSRNGTWLGAARIDGAGVSVAAGARIGFGSEEPAWELLSAGPPHAVAIALDGAWVQGADGVLLLPPEGDPVLTIHESSPGVWICDGPEGVVPARTGDVVTVLGRSWRIELPEPDEQTWERDAERVGVGNATFRFAVSADEEYVELSAAAGSVVVPLGSRTHNYTLLTLARLRVRDGRDGVAESERGWVHLDDLGRMLRLPEQRLNLDVYRLRKQLAKAGIEQAGRIVERRAYQKLLRFGSPRIDITPLEGSTAND